MLTVEIFTLFQHLKEQGLLGNSSLQSTCSATPDRKLGENGENGENGVLLFEWFSGGKIIPHCCFFLFLFFHI